MQVSQLLLSAFNIARLEQVELNKTWIKASLNIGFRFRNSLISSSVQKAGELDLLLRCLENEFKSSTTNQDDAQMFVFNILITFSELWIGSIYEIVRLIQDRKVVSSESLSTLYNDLTLLRVPLMKHEIAKERKMNEPLVFKKYPHNNDETDLYTYSREDPYRGHIMLMGVSPRGSVMWNVIDITKRSEFWVERLALSERFISIFADNL
jgi:hypothetical protein